MTADERTANRIYAARNRTKQRRHLFTFEAMWKMAADKAMEKWGKKSASLYAHMAIHEALKRDGFNFLDVCISDIR